MPAEFIVLSHPPWLRYKSDHILASFLLPDGLSAAQQKKFFDKIIELDYNPLFTEGITDPSGRVFKVEIFGATLDLKGREKFLNQVSVQSYVGCAHCRAVFPKGHGGPCFGIARKSLPVGHPLRNRTCGVHFQYKAPEVSGHLHPHPYPILNATLTLTTTNPDACRSAKNERHRFRSYGSSPGVEGRL